jgi:hypothetical protein
MISISMGIKESKQRVILSSFLFPVEAQIPGFVVGISGYTRVVHLGILGIEEREKERVEWEGVNE